MPGQRNETSLGAGGRDFRPTAWTEVLAARDADTTEARLAWDQLVGVYWKPVYFGLAKMAAGAPGAAGVKPEGHATVSGQVMGTPHYMAPEQVENMARVDHRADIYSLGVVFYEMLTGELPLGRFPAPSQRVQVDVRFDEVVLKALEKEPERRYQTVTDMKGDVTALRPVGGAGARLVPDARGPAARPHSRKSVWMKVLSAALLLANAVGAAMLCHMVIRTHDRFLGMYEGIVFGRLPALSELAFAVPTSVYVVALCSLLLALVVKEVAPIRRSVTIWVNVAALTLGMSFFWFYNLSVYLPLAAMGERLMDRHGGGGGWNAAPPEARGNEPVSCGQPANGLRARLEVKQTRIIVGQTLRDVAVSLNNVGSEPVRFAGSPTRAAAWSFRFEDVSGSQPAVEFRLSGRDDRPALVQALGAGEGCGFVEDDLDDRWEAKNAGAPGRVLHPSELPPGKYRLTATYRGGAAAGLWQGSVSTGPVEIEIVGPGKASPSGQGPAAPAIEARLVPPIVGGIRPGDKVVAQGFVHYFANPAFTLSVSDPFGSVHLDGSPAPGRLSEKLDGKFVEVTGIWEPQRGGSGVDRHRMGLIRVSGIETVAGDLPKGMTLQGGHLRPGTPQDIAWGEPVDGLRLGLSPRNLVMDGGRLPADFCVRISNAGGRKPLTVRPGSYHLFWEVDRGGRKTLGGCRAGLDDRPFDLLPGRSYRLQEGGVVLDLSEHFGSGIAPAAGETVGLRIGVNMGLGDAKPEPKNWDRPDTLRSGSIAVSRKPELPPTLVRAENVVWGQRMGALQGGLRIEQGPAGPAAHREFTLFLRNHGGKAAEVSDPRVNGAPGWSMSFRGLADGKTYEAWLGSVYLPERPPAIKLDPTAAVAIPLAVGDWFPAGANLNPRIQPTVRMAEPCRLPPGRYEVSLTYAEKGAGCVAGPVEITIIEPGKGAAAEPASASAPAPAPTK
jgi:hypothetical protein